MHGGGGQSEERMRRRGNEYQESTVTVESSKLVVFRSLMVARRTQPVEESWVGTVGGSGCLHRCGGRSEVAMSTTRVP